MSNPNTNPFDKWKLGFQALPAAQNGNPGGNLTPAAFADPGGTKSTTKDSLVKNIGVQVDFPNHLFIPAGAQSIDITRACLVLTGTTRESLMQFTAPDGGITAFISYGVFTDAEFASTIEFIPAIDNARVFPFHGDPNNNFRINIGTGPDLSNNSLKQAHIVMQPGQVFNWYVTNSDILARVMGVRMVGYFMSSQQIEATRFGG